MNLDLRPIHTFLNQTHQCVGHMLANAMFIQKELPSLRMSNELRGKVEGLCEDLIGNKFDLTSEVMDLHQKLSEESLTKEAIERKIIMMHGWVEFSHVLFKKTVNAAQAEIDAGKADSSLFILLAESATNLLKVSPYLPEFRELCPPLLNEGTEEEKAEALEKRTKWLQADKRRLQEDLRELHYKQKPSDEGIE